MQTALAFLVPPVVVIFLCGLFCKRAGPSAALVTLIGGHVVSAICFAATLSGLLALHFTLIAGLIFGVSFCIYWLVYRHTPQGALSADSPYSWRPDLARASVGGPWWADYRVQAVALMGLTLWMVVTFW